MCGIVGFWSPDGLRVDDAQASLRAMAAQIRHRGPDDEGTWLDGEAGIALGFQRLAIIDLTSTGHQPMISASGRYVVVYNGEIYNFQELRRELESHGARFRGRSDTEVLLAGVETWGLHGTLERCNGMFAFALWDRAERILHFARDRAGEKPLYYGWLGRTLVFGSELKGLRAHPDFRAPLSRDAVAVFLRRGYVPSPYCIYEGIRKLPPGTSLSLRLDPGRPVSLDEPVAYWSARDVAERGLADPYRGTPEDAVDALDALLSDAVRLRMVSDVPLGAFLSGGTDSSTIVALMQAHNASPVRTFTIGFQDETSNEAPYAAAVAQHLGTMHTELYLTPAAALAVIPRLPDIYDEPFADTSQIPTYLVSQMARRHVTVSLSGDAGDELFGGYRRHRLGPAIWHGIGWLPVTWRRRVARALAPSSDSSAAVGLMNRLTRGLTGKRNLVERLRQTADMLPAESPAALYHYMMSFWKNPVDVVPGARELPLPATNDGQGPDLRGAASSIMMFLDTIAYLPDDILVKLDRASMSVSLEARVPLLDHRVIEFAWRLPVSLKLRHGEGKWILRRVLDKYVPKHLVNRPKRGFHMPVADWLRGPLREWADALLDESKLRQDGMLDPQPVLRKWREHLTGVSRWDYHLWTVLMLQAWKDSTLTARRAVTV
jgi:asparagine synthase (glutamine-hydrolysing)